jgi:hypothetical protein
MALADVAQRLFMSLLLWTGVHDFHRKIDRATPVEL